MSNRFPESREFKSRHCFECKKDLKFGEFFLRNRTYSQEYLISLWQSENLEFLCCLCYDSAIQSLKVDEVKKNVNEKDLSIIRMLESRFKHKIPLINEIKFNTCGYIVNNNRITGLGLFQLGISLYPEEINFLSNLKRLNLAWNKIECLPSSILNLSNLEEMDLIGNFLNKLPDDLYLLSKLKEIDVSFNKIEKFPENIEKMKSLRKLKLIKNPINQNLKKIDELKNFGIEILL